MLLVDTQQPSHSQDSFLNTAYWEDPAFTAAAAQFDAEQGQVKDSPKSFDRLEVYIPAWHWCEDGDKCQESIERAELIQHIFASTGQIIENNFCGNISYQQKAKGETVFKKLPLTGVEQPASPLSPCSARSLDLRALGRRPVRETVSTYLKDVLPASGPLPPTLPPGYETAMITPPREVLPRRPSHHQLPRLDTTSPPRLQRYTSQPDLHRVRSSLEVRPSPSRSITAQMAPLRASLDSVWLPINSWSSPVSSLRRSHSLEASRMLTTVAEDHVANAEAIEVSSEGKVLMQTATSSTAYRSAAVSGWLRYRKTKLLGTEWRRLHYRFNDTLLCLYLNETSKAPLKILNVIDYSVTQNGMAARTSSSKIGALMKKLKLSSVSEEPLVPRDMISTLELIPEPERVSSISLKMPKLHIFAVRDDAESTVFASNVMMRKFEWHQEQGHRPVLNGRELITSA